MVRVALMALCAALCASLMPAGAAVAAPAAQVPSSPCAVAVATALTARGRPYEWGQAGPAAYDCSGLISYAWGQAGHELGRTTYDQVLAGVSLPCRLNQIATGECWQPGDLLFARTNEGYHVSMYAGAGLVIDAYHPATGVILHNPATNPFYLTHFWQGRRVTSCADAALIGPPPGAADTTLFPVAGVERIPDILAPVSFSVPQCGSCDPQGRILLPATEWEETWPTGWELLNPVVVTRLSISWLGWQIREIARQIICWLFTMLQLLANMLASLTNIIVAGVNAIWHQIALLFLMMRGWFLTAWGLFEWIRQMLIDILAAIYNVVIALGGTGELLLLFLSVVGRLIMFLGSMAYIAISVIGWIGGLALGLISIILGAFQATATPTQLVDSHIIYQMVRGSIEAFRDSPVGWLMYLAWGMAYVGFVIWLSRFLSAGGEPQ